MTAAPAWAVPSGWLVLSIWKPGKLKCEEWVKCVYEISAMSILLFWRVAKSSFLCFIRPFEFQVSMRSEFDVMLLIDIICFYETWEDSGKERYERVNNWFEFINKFEKWNFIVVSRRSFKIRRLVTLSYISIRTWSSRIPIGWMLLVEFWVSWEVGWWWLLRWFIWDVVLFTAELLVYCAAFIISWVRTFAEGAFGWKVWWFLTGGR